jgi:hypothetical protein
MPPSSRLRLWCSNGKESITFGATKCIGIATLSGLWLVARGARLLGGVGVNIHPEYRVLAETERALAEDVLKDLATAIQLDAMEGITFCEIETSESGGEN